MKVYINKHGSLSLEKRGKMVAQYCPKTVDQHGDPSPCGEWCPFFIIGEWQDDEDIKGGYLYIQMCDRIKSKVSALDYSEEASNA